MLKKNYTRNCCFLKKNHLFAINISNFLQHMKKFFTLLCCAPLILMAQAPQRVDTRAIKEANAVKASEMQSPVVNKLRSAPMHKTNGDAPVYGAKTIGNTLYDLQSNNSLASRLQVYPNGKITAAWTTSSDGGTSYSQRGTGYNQRSAGVWRKALPNNSRFETSRVGWPCVGVATFGSVEKEYVFAHAVATSGLTGGFVFSTNTGIGTDFTAGGTVLNDTYNTATTPGPIWARSATAGTKIVLISCFADSSSSYPVNYYKNGVKRPITYSIYNAAGQAWVTKNAVLPGYDSTRYDIGNADDYAVDALGNKIRIVIGGLFDDLALWSSDDGGANWNKVIIDSFKRANPTPRTSPKPMNNGAVAVSIDASGVTHVAYPILGAAWDSVDGTTISNYIFYGTDREGIAYWNDKKDLNGKYSPIQVIGGTPDMDGDGVITLAANARSRTYGGYGSALSFTQNGASVSYAALSNQPMLSYDSKGNVFCTYIAPIENDESADAENFNDIFVVYSKDGGKTWGDPQNLTQTAGFEDFYPTTARTADNTLKVMYFLKDDVGISVNNANNPETTTRVNYMEIPVSKILSDSVGKFPNGINPAYVDADFKVSQNYPNPFHGFTQIDFTVSTTSDITFTVTDLLGKVLFTENSANTEAGKHSIYFNSGALSTGIYFYTISNGTQKVTEKMIVE